MLQSSSSHDQIAEELRETYHASAPSSFLTAFAGADEDVQAAVVLEHRELSGTPPPHGLTITEGEGIRSCRRSSSKTTSV
ncbi:hypothetical protein COP1_025188 [Malus domestica]